MWRREEVAEYTLSIRIGIWKSAFNVTWKKQRESAYNITTRWRPGASFAPTATIPMARIFTALKISA
jgi:hypothetical protein